MKFIVDRRTWFRGKGPFGSRLLTTDGRRCCIGFVAAQCGVPDSDLREVAVLHDRCDAYPSALNGLESYFPVLPAWMTLENGMGSSDLSNAYNVNDSTFIYNPEREAQLQEIFARNGDEIEFIN